MAGASLRVELFPASLPIAIDFYTRVLSFRLLRHEPDGPTTGYAHLRRDGIQIGLATKTPNEFPEAAQDPDQRKQFRTWPTGVELVIEVDDLQAEWQRVNAMEWPVDDGLKLQGWGLRDFRILDPDGFYLRISERGGEDGRAVDTDTSGELLSSVWMHGDIGIAGSKFGLVSVTGLSSLDKFLPSANAHSDCDICIQTQNRSLLLNELCSETQNSIDMASRSFLARMMTADNKVFASVLTKSLAHPMGLELNDFPPEVYNTLPNEQEAERLFEEKDGEKLLRDHLVPLLTWNGLQEDLAPCIIYKELFLEPDERLVVVSENQKTTWKVRDFLGRRNKVTPGVFHVSDRALSVFEYRVLSECEVPKSQSALRTYEGVFKEAYQLLKEYNLEGVIGLRWTDRFDEPPQ